MFTTISTPTPTSRSSAATRGEGLNERIVINRSIPAFASLYEIATVPPRSSALLFRQTKPRMQLPEKGARGPWSPHPITFCKLGETTPRPAAAPHRAIPWRSSRGDRAPYLYRSSCVAHRRHAGRHAEAHVRRRQTAAGFRPACRQAHVPLFRDSSRFETPRRLPLERWRPG